MRWFKKILKSLCLYILIACFLLTITSYTSNYNYRRRRVPVVNLVFMKTHKTASSTTQNILLRYGLHNSLKFALPRNTHDFNYPKIFDRKSVAKHGNFSYNIMCHHMRFNLSEVQAVMPNNSVFVTIVREPGKLFESTFDYFWPIVPAFQKVPHQGNDSMETWLDNADEYMRVAKGSKYGHLAKNPTFFDLGYSNVIEDDAYIKKSISEISKIFDLVMVTDHFKESIVLLADLLGWDLKELAYINQNSRNYETNTNDVTKVTRITDKARRWSKADAALFDYFNATLWKKVKKYGYRRMAKSVAELDKSLEWLKRTCIKTENSVNSSKVSKSLFQKSLYIPPNVSMTGYRLKLGAERIKICRQAVAPENGFSKMVFDLQKHKTKFKTNISNTTKKTSFL